MLYISLLASSSPLGCTRFPLTFPVFTLLELHQYACVDEAAGEVIGYGVVIVVDVLYPIVGVDIVDAQQVECVNAQPDILEVLAYACTVTPSSPCRAPCGTFPSVP